ncbi:putative sulfate exporter family transporter [Halopenitus sp. POP-27]|uniref:YeiH family protein n=1 Tax=Halopenitus sp. POP-27 TaxID=2994425 RepID=UPI002468D2B6|nr:putative sulfate exporter family transporter [Halopenitus sp. POP-27]
MASTLWAGGRRVLPGIAVLVLVGLLARVVTAVVPIGSHLLVAIGIGAFVANVFGVPDWATPGVDTHGLWLEAGIVLLGATVAVGRVIGAGGRVLAIVLGAVIATVLLVEALSRWVIGIDEKAGSLLAAGSGICGVSAVAAVAGAIDPDRRQVAYATATVLLFDAVTLVAYPAVGRLLGLSDVVFGVWAGSTMFSTGPVTAAGLAYSPAAGEWAVLVKLARNALIGVVAVGYAMYYAGGANASGATRGPHREPHDDGTHDDGAHDARSAVRARLRQLREGVPVFLLGFLLLIALSTIGVFTPAQRTAIGNTSSWLFLVAFAGLGMRMNVREFREAGIAPVVVVLLALVVVSSGTLAVAMAIL